MRPAHVAATGHQSLGFGWGEDSQFKRTPSLISQPQNAGCRGIVSDAEDQVGEMALASAAMGCNLLPSVPPVYLHLQGALCGQNLLMRDPEPQSLLLHPVPVCVCSGSALAGLPGLRLAPMHFLGKYRE